MWIPNHQHDEGGDNDAYDLDADGLPHMQTSSPIDAHIDDHIPGPMNTDPFDFKHIDMSICQEMFHHIC